MYRSGTSPFLIPNHFKNLENYTKKSRFIDLFLLYYDYLNWKSDNREILNPAFCGFYTALSYLILCPTVIQLIVPNMTITQIHETGAPRLPFSCIQMHGDDWKLSGSLEEALPHLSTWGGWLTCFGSCTYLLFLGGDTSNSPTLHLLC